MRRSIGGAARVACVFAASSASLSATSPISVAPAPAPPITYTSIGSTLIGGLTPGMTVERYLADLVAPIRSFAADAQGLTAADVARERRKAQAENRADLLRDVMRYDLNGDAVVTRAEVNTAARPGRTPGMVDALFDRYDADGDGRITMAEIDAAAADGGHDYQADRLATLLALDSDKDGRLTIAELTGLGRAAFDRVDTDGNGVISPAEYQASEPARRQWSEDDRRAQAERFGPRCLLQPAPTGAQVVAIGIYDAPALSAVSIGGSDVATDFTLVHIEKGKAPLYIVLTSYESMVWKFDGDVGRVAKVAVSSYVKKGGTPAAGVAGVKPDRVAFIRGDCLQSYYNVKSTEAAEVRGVLTRSLGKAPDQFAGAYSPRAVSLPSGTIEQADRHEAIPAPPGFDAPSWTDAVRFWPAGIGKVDPKAVVSKLPVVSYDIFPSQAGLSQLLGSGALVRDARGDFKIVRPIAHFPADMTGSHSTTLTIGKGVPRPAGNPGHSCVRTEDGSAAPTGPVCS